MNWLSKLFALLSVAAVVAVAAAAGDDVEKALRAKDFWARVGLNAAHSGLTPAAVQAAANNSKDGLVRLRAFTVLCDLNGNARCLPDIERAEAAKAIEGCFRYLESHLNDKTVQKFHPEVGFTHVGLSRKGGDADGLWLLIEDTRPRAPSSGLNLRWNAKAAKVDKIEHWGVTREP